MIDILTKIISTLTNDSTLVAMVPAKNILTGPIDIVEDTIPTLTMPQINLSTISEEFRTVPDNAKDTNIDLDIWVLDNQLLLEQIYERVIVLLNKMTADSGSTHIFWQLLGGAHDQYESNRRIWHKTMMFKVWSI